MAGAVGKKVEFVIPASKGAEARELKQHVVELFDVEVSFGSDPSAVTQTGIEWIYITGNEKSVNAAKNYIISACTPEQSRIVKVPFTLQHLFTENINHTLVELEKKHYTYVQFSSNGICVKGKAIEVTLILSYLEEQIPIWEQLIRSQNLSIRGLIHHPKITENLRIFARRLGFSENQIEIAASKCGPSLNENSLLQELVIHCGKGIVCEETCQAEEEGSLLAYSGTSMDKEDKTKIKSFGEHSSQSTSSTVTAESNAELRHIVIDGSNVAMCHGNKEIFSCRGIQICVDWFKNQGHSDITVIVPQWRKELSKVESPILDQKILLQLEKERVLVFTPSRRVNGRRVVCYDDRYIVKVAAQEDGIIVSNDHFHDLEKESPEYKQVIEQRLLMYSFVNDRFMPPDDPLGRHGPSLNDFLKKGTPLHPKLCPYGRRCTYGQKCRYHHPEKQSTLLKKEVEPKVMTASRTDDESKSSSPISQSLLAGNKASLQQETSRSVEEASSMKIPRQKQEAIVGSSVQSRLQPSFFNSKPSISCAMEMKQSHRGVVNIDQEVVARGGEATATVQNVNHKDTPISNQSRVQHSMQSKQAKDTNDKDRIRTPPLSPMGKKVIANGYEDQSKVQRRDFETGVPSTAVRQYPSRGNFVEPSFAPQVHDLDYSTLHSVTSQEVQVRPSPLTRVPPIYHRDGLSNGEIYGSDGQKPWVQPKLYMLPVQPSFQPTQGLANGMQEIPFIPGPIYQTLCGGQQYMPMPQQRTIILPEGPQLQSYPKETDVEFQRFMPVHVAKSTDTLLELQSRFPGQNDRIVNVLRQHPYESNVDVLSWLIRNQVR